MPGGSWPRRLGLDPAAVTIATAPSGARQLAVVQSAPLVQRLSEMMDHSDNVLAECIAREVAAAINRPQSFAGAVDAVTNRLSTAHVDTTGAALVDSSGLSVDDRLTAKTLDGVVQAAAGPDQPSLRALLDLLPIAGGSGTLADRFLDPATDRGPAGWLRAKTGSLTAINSLVGVLTDHSGRVLTFAFISNDAGPNGRNAMDDAGHQALVLRVRMTPLVEPDPRYRRRLAIRRDRRPTAGPAGPGGQRLHPSPGDRRADERGRESRTARARRHRPDHRRRGARGPHRRPPAVDRRGGRVDAGDDQRNRKAARGSSPAASPVRRRAPCWRSCPRESSASTTRSPPRKRAACCWCIRTSSPSSASFRSSPPISGCGCACTRSPIGCSSPPTRGCPITCRRRWGC